LDTTKVIGTVTVHITGIFFELDTTKVICTVTVHITSIFTDILPLSTRNNKYKCVNRQVKNIAKATATRWKKVFNHELKSSGVFKYQTLTLLNNSPQQLFVTPVMMM
jgi:hypothetical protein